MTTVVLSMCGKISLQGLVLERDKKKTDITAAAAWPKNSAAGGGDLVIQVSSFGVGQRQGPDRNAAEGEKGSRSTGWPEGLFFFCPIPPMYGAGQVWLDGWQWYK